MYTGWALWFSVYLFIPYGCHFPCLNINLWVWSSLLKLMTAGYNWFTASYSGCTGSFIFWWVNWICWSYRAGAGSCRAFTTRGNSSRNVVSCSPCLVYYPLVLEAYSRSCTLQQFSCIIWIGYISLVSRLKFLLFYFCVLIPWICCFLSLPFSFYLSLKTLEESFALDFFY